MTSATRRAQPVLSMLALAASLFTAGANAALLQATYTPPGPGFLTVDNTSYGALNFTAVPNVAGEAINEVVVSLDIAKDAPLDEIIFILYGPNDGVHTHLIGVGAFSGMPGGTQGRVTLTFDDRASSVIGSTSPAGGGSFQPWGNSLYSTFHGRNEAGTWSLYVQDTGIGSPITFYGATLYVATGTDVVPVPEPAAFAQMLVGLGLLGLARRFGRPRP